MTLFVPTLAPFNFHWNVGVVPPLIGVAVKVTLVPEQIVEALALMLTLAGKLALTVTIVVLKLLMAVLQPEPEDRLVIVTVVDPVFNAEVVKVPVPGLPAVKVIVAVLPVAEVEPDKL